MERVCIPHGETPAAGNRLFLDFLSRFDRVEPFYRRPPTLDALEAAAREIRFPDDRRAALVDALRRQNESAGRSVRAALDKLSRPGAVAVVSGQQTGYLGGPAYAVYKALSAIRLADSLERRGVSAVAVFWLATEAHDLDEAAPAWLPDADGRPLKLEAATEQAAAVRPVSPSWARPVGDLARSVLRAGLCGGGRRVDALGLR